MEPMTTSLIAELMPKLHAAFPRNVGAQNPTMMIEVYRNGLRGLSGESVRAAVDRVIQDDAYFPKVARLRELAQQWQRHNAVHLEKPVEVPWNRCPVCGAVAKPRMIPRQKRDPAKGFAVMVDQNGAAIWEDVESVQLYMDHDPNKHHVVQEALG